MTIESSYNTKQKPTPTYPKLMINERYGTIFMMTSCEVGTCLVRGTDPTAGVGVHYTRLNIGILTDFNYELTLKNKIEE